MKKKNFSSITNKKTSSLFNLEERHAENLADFIDHLGKSRLWHLLPHGENDPDKAICIFDAQTGLRYPAEKEIQSIFDSHSFLYIKSSDNQQHLAILETKTRLLWNNESSTTTYPLDSGKNIVQKARWANIKNWQIPSKSQLYSFATTHGNPYRSEQEYRLNTAENKTDFRWLTKEGCLDTDSGYWSPTAYPDGYIFSCNEIWQDKSTAKIIESLINLDWQLEEINEKNNPIVTGALRSISIFNEAFGIPPLETIESLTNKDQQPEKTNKKNPIKTDPRWKNTTYEKLLANLIIEKLQLKAIDSEEILNPRKYMIDLQMFELDYTPCRLPKLDSTQLCDPEKGLWELWGEPAETLARFDLVARDPGRDVQRRAVSIDFGTSSTVVAVDTSNGGRELLRIGVRDFYQSVQPQHFENPTVLECLDYSAFAQAWTESAYRPALDWTWMRAAHEAQASFRDNPGDTKILASILPRLKQWALRSNEHSRVRITDRQGLEVELAPHSENNPVRGQPLNVSAKYPFDPIELYAWYLGMAINWRERGVFLKYYLSFPVKYPREVKERILASFRRGLQRSLPYSLIEHHPQVLNDFEVNDLASEPAAYAAAALPHLGVEPSEAGVPYAVFDFGGGTSDFDYGLLRWATEEEEYMGYEQVFEHLASSGDNFLGGENLLEHLVYESFRQNLEVLRKERIQFTKPLDALPFAGSEAFLANTQAAQTNSIMLAARLRTFLEGDQPDLAAQIKLDLIDANGSKKTCELALDAQALDGLLAARIRCGATAFLAELARIQSELPAGVPIHVLLAGNGSRSRHVQRLFDTQGSQWAELLTQTFADNPPEILVHQPLPMNTDNPHAPTTKTGVALGLLRLVPGKNTLLVDHLRQRHDGQAPFAWFAGRLRRGRFDPALAPGATYQHWHELGPLQQGVFNLYASSSPRSHHGLPEGDPELKMFRLDFPAAPLGARLFARAVTPNTLEMATATDINRLGESMISSMVLG